VVLAVDALGVDLEQDGDAVPGPLGDLVGWDTPIESTCSTRFSMARLRRPEDLPQWLPLTALPLVRIEGTGGVCR